MDAPFNVCPDCNAALQAFYVKSADGKTLIEIDGCRRCRGLWLDAGELERVTGMKLSFTDLGGETARRCARCRKPMTNLLADGGVPVESCRDCRGLFFDAGELAQLGAAQVEGPAAEALRARVEFQCVKCQGRFPMTQGHAMGAGLVCGRCVPQSGELPLDKFMSGDDDDEPSRPSEAAVVGTLGALGFVFDLLTIFF